MPMNRVDPRVRAYGKARIDITRRAKDEQEWQDRWKEPRYPFPFTWGASWKQSVQYYVDDFAAEVGFLMDVLGLPACTFSPSSAIFTSPDQAFSFSVAETPEGNPSTPPEALRIQFMVQDILRIQQELERRGVVFEQAPHLNGAGPGLYSGYFRTPHGICVDLIGTPEDGRGLQPGDFQSIGDSAPGDLEQLGESANDLEDEPSAGEEYHSKEVIGSGEPEPPSAIENPFSFGPEADTPLASPALRPEPLHGLDLRRRASEIFPHHSGVRRNGGLRGAGDRKPAGPFRPGSSLRRGPGSPAEDRPLPGAPQPLGKNQPTSQTPDLPKPDPAPEKVEPPRQESLFQDPPVPEKEDEPRYENIEDSGGSEEFDDFIA